RMFPHLTLADVLYTTAGVRALVREQGRPSAVSRMHTIVDDVPARGTVSILGGKITGYRAIAEEAVDAVCRRLRVAARCVTAERTLPGAFAGSSAGHEQSLGSDHSNLAAQVVFAVRSEHCRRVSDFIRRRTRLGASADQGWNAARRVAEIMGAELSWPPSRIAAEIEDYGRDIAATRAFAGPS
ncbi:MAG: hypothetical protein JF610_15485, partial [Acidobacteria bacterium]|nr:hypothetical protein [Acidobacteriota bacterium]